MSRSLLCIALACAVGCKNKAAPPSSPPPPVDGILFHHVRVFDGTAAIPDQDVLVRNGVIVTVAAQVDANGAQIIDGTGKTLVPGLIDAHAHVFDVEQLRSAPIFGVTTVLDMGTDFNVVRDFKAKLQAQAGRSLADLRSAGTLITAPKGHGTEYGFPIPTLVNGGDAAAFVKARVDEGSDYIKIIYDDGHVYGITFGAFDKPTLRALIDAAHAAKKLAVVHIGTQRDALDALEAGADGLAHLFVDQAPSPELFALAAKNHAFVIATLSILHSIAGTSAGPELAADPALAPYLSDDDLTNLPTAFPKHAGAAALDAAFGHAAVKGLVAANVPVLAGTDAGGNPGTAHGASLLGELALLVDAGMTPAAALAAATSTPARVFSLADRGRIAAGLRADLVLVDGDPTVDIKSMRRIAGVWRQGVPIDRAAYAAAIKTAHEQARAEATKPPPPGSESGLVSDFESGTSSAVFGHGWDLSLDSIAGGASKGEMKIVTGGANGSKGALAISGTVAAGAMHPWAGVMYSPGKKEFGTVNLSAKKGLAFWAKGDGRTYTVMLFTKHGGQMPAFTMFSAGPTWKQQTFPWTTFDGVDGSDLQGVFIGAAEQPGAFALQIDDVRFQ